MTREEALNDWLPIIRQMVKGTEVYTEALDMAIKALEQQPTDAVDRVTIKEYLYSLGMGIKVTATDAVDRQVVIDAIDDDNRNGHYSCFASNNDAECFKQIIRDLPSVTPQQKMGQWISYNWNDNGIARWGIKCDQCYKEYRYGGEMGGTYKYCPFCGCKMQGVEE